MVTPAAAMDNHAYRVNLTVSGPTDKLWPWGSLDMLAPECGWSLTGLKFKATPLMQFGRSPTRSPPEF